ncbi:major facilitator superfamily transporter [Massarina eburnea CBS 473.64]|uniref:Major facilitator superfamily transporter n=1 Tax=Massarina eburnea CBS 473.64 TaxID=1395130 RepID=A0A6A6SEY5_9PLEO|nr:major facilitator superfamily transporter [Massarina eburnea CBS 473.64]
MVTYRRSSEGTIGKAVGSVNGEQADLWPTSQESEKHTPEPYYCVYTETEKRVFLVLVAAAGTLPTFSFSIILPSLVTIATDLRMSLEAINLSIMFFLLVHAIAPMVWGPLSDSLGRRPVYIYSLLVFLITTINLSLSINYPMFLAFKGLQAAGIASLSAIGCLVIQDITPVQDRERHFAFYHGFRNASLVIAPVIGGLMTNFVNFRSLFTLLWGLTLAVTVAILLLLPETHRPIAGNGNRPLTGTNLPLIWQVKFFGDPAHVDNRLSPGVAPKLKLEKFVQPLRLLLEKDILLSLIFSGVIYAIWIMVTVSTAGLFKTTFGINDALIGLAFLPNAVGTIAGSTLIGNLLNVDFLNAAAAYKKEHQLPASVVISKHALPSDFPLEHTRRIRLPGLTIVFIISLSLYGFTLMYPSLTSLGGWIFIPLFLQLLIAVMAHAICGVHQTLISDLWPCNSMAVAAAGNLIKYGTAAIGVAVVQKMIVGLDTGPAFLGLGLVVIILVPLLILQWYFGDMWRRRREDELVQRGIVEKSDRIYYT